jgi:hypothetical protein
VHTSTLCVRRDAHYFPFVFSRDRVFSSRSRD